MAEYIKEIRKKVGKEKILLPGTSCLLLDEKDRVLLMLRSDTDTWSTLGGFMDLGETVLESVRREVREETGLEIDRPEVLAIFSGPDFETHHPNGDESAPVTILFFTRDYTGAIRESDESVRLEFRALDDLPEPLEDSSRTAIRYLREHLEGNRELPVVL